MAEEIIMPSLGESVFEGTIAKWLKKEGDKVEQYEPILEIETDKVTTEATAEESGTLLKIIVPEGQTVEVGTVLAYVGDPGDEIPESDKLSTAEAEIEQKPKSSEESPTIVKKPATPAKPEPATNGPGQATRRYTGRISPVVGRIAEEHQVDLNQVTGTGRDGRITKKDILAYIKERERRPAEPSRPAVATPEPAVAPEQAPEAVPGEVLALSSMRQAIAEHMVRSKRTSPHVTTVFDVDFTAVASHREAHKG
ncbi:MAG: E3 binding domain-containing protein, partial [Chloroflexota bacterium]